MCIMLCSSSSANGLYQVSMFVFPASFKMNQKPPGGGVETAMFPRNHCQWETRFISQINGQNDIKYFTENGQHFIYLSVGKITKPKPENLF